MYREEVFLDKYPEQDNGGISSLINFSTHPTVYNLMSYNQEYNEQPIYEIDCLNSDDSDSDNSITRNLYRSYL